MEPSGHSRAQGSEVRWQVCPSCGNSKWAVSQNADTGAWTCYSCGAKGAVDTGASADKLLGLLTPTHTGLCEWPEVALPDWRPLTRTGRKYLRDRGIGNPEDFGIVEVAEGGRVLIPYFGPSGAIIYWVTRAFVPDGKPKYMGATGRKPLYVLPEWKEMDSAVFVEGPVDALVHWLATGVPTIALGGKSLTGYNRAAIDSMVGAKRTIILDNDALLEAMALGAELGAEVVCLPAGLDPAEHWKEGACAKQSS